MEYGVVFEPFTQRHYIKNFAKKYKAAWVATETYLRLEFTKIDLLFLKSIAETISDSEKFKICKTEFKVAGTDVSRHGSGNRCIVAIHKDEMVVHVLLVYCKTDVQGHRETDWWQAMIRDNFPLYWHLL